MSRHEHYVCDLTLYMRTRLICGCYNKRSVSPRWRILAKAYCMLITAAAVLYMYVVFSNGSTLTKVRLIPSLGPYVINAVIALVTEDEYIYKYYTRTTTDVTLDSPKVFGNLQKQMKRTYIAIVSIKLAYFVWITLSSWHLAGFYVLNVTFPYFIVDFMVTSSMASKYLVMTQFNARMLVLKRRLQRYGFRTPGRAPPQPYYEIYNEILQGLNEINNEVKLVIFFDLISNSCRLITSNVYYANAYTWQIHESIVFMSTVSQVVAAILIRLFLSFGHVASLESAATICEDMAEFTATQLIKNPTSSERQRMHHFLTALDRRGARFYVLRGLLIDARFVLGVLAFCIAQVLVFVNSLDTTAIL